MQLGKGDRVKFLNDTGSGVITRINDNRTAMVLIDEGFEVPMRLSELIPVGKSDETYQASGRAESEPDRPGEDGPQISGRSAGDGYGEENGTGPGFAGEFTDEAGKPGGDTGNERAGRGKPERNFLLAFVATADNDGLDAWLINDSSFHVYYTFLLKQGNEDAFLNLKTGMVEPDTKLFIKTFVRDQINTFITLRVQALFFSRGIFEPVPPSQKEVPLDPAEMFGTDSLTVNDYFDENARIIPLISDAHEREMVKLSEGEISRLSAGKNVTPEPSGKDVRKDGKKDDPLIEEVDLHIEELIDDYSGLSGREVLDLQMARFTTALEGALRGRTRRIVFIHGIGNGKLKFEIRKTFDKKYPRLRYQDASFREYGYGATMVIIRK